VKYRSLLGVLAAVAAGVLVAWVDARPNWDDTGVLAFMILCASAGAVWIGAPAWLAALAVAGPVVAPPLLRGEWLMLLPLGIALVGAFAALLVRRAVSSRSAVTKS
jgi:hypothetical protein